MATSRSKINIKQYPIILNQYGIDENLDTPIFEDFINTIKDVNAMVMDNVYLSDIQRVVKDTEYLKKLKKVASKNKISKSLKIKLFSLGVRNTVFEMLRDVFDGYFKVISTPNEKLLICNTKKPHKFFKFIIDKNKVYWFHQNDYKKQIIIDCSDCIICQTLANKCFYK